MWKRPEVWNEHEVWKRKRDGDRRAARRARCAGHGAVVMLHGEHFERSMAKVVEQHAARVEQGMVLTICERGERERRDGANQPKVERGVVPKQRES